MFSLDLVWFPLSVLSIPHETKAAGDTRHRLVVMLLERMGQMVIACSVCQKDDAIQKVSAVLTGSQATGTFSGPLGGVAYVGGKRESVGSYTTLCGSTMSELVRMLAPPAEPKKRSGFDCLDELLMVCVVVDAVFGIGVAVIALIIGSFKHDIQILVVGAGVPFLLGIIAGGIYLWLLDGKENWKPQSEARYAMEKSAWDAAMARWNRLYYCYRDGIVFDAETPETCQPQDMKQFIYRQK